MVASSHAIGLLTCIHLILQAHLKSNGHRIGGLSTDFSKSADAAVEIPRVRLRSPKLFKRAHPNYSACDHRRGLAARSAHIEYKTIYQLNQAQVCGLNVRRHWYNQASDGSVRIQRRKTDRF